MKEFHFNYDKVKKHKLYTIAYPIAFIVDHVFIRTKYIGQKNIPKKGGYIIACNHTSYADPILLGTNGVRQVYFMAKEELFKNKFLRWLLVNLNAFPIKRGASDTTSVEFAVKVIKAGKVMGIFPEGTREKDYAPHSPKAGVALIAKVTGADILPVSIYCDGPIRPFKKVTVRFGKLIKNEELGIVEGKTREIKNAAVMIMNEIKALWEEKHCK